MAAESIKGPPRAKRRRAGWQASAAGSPWAGARPAVPSRYELVRPFGSSPALLLAAAIPWTAWAAAGDDDRGRVEEALARGDEAWERRAEGRHGLEADPAPIAAAVAAYEQAVAATPESATALERLLRALYFQAQFAAGAAAGREELHRRARDLAEDGLDRLCSGLGDRQRLPPERIAAAVRERAGAAALFFWAAAHWGLWGEETGRLAAARQGVARRVRDYATTVTLIDEHWEQAGGHRILGRLHTEAPRIPLVTGWVDRDLAVEALERAAALAADEPLNRLYLADALLRFRPGRRAEALSILEALVASPPRSGHLLEDERARRDAHELLAGQGRDAAVAQPENRNSMTSPSRTR